MQFYNTQAINGGEHQACLKHEYKVLKSLNSHLNINLPWVHCYTEERNFSYIVCIYMIRDMYALLLWFCNNLLQRNGLLSAISQSGLMFLNTHLSYLVLLCFRFTFDYFDSVPCFVVY